VPKRPKDIRSLARAYTTRGIEILGGIAESSKDDNARNRAIGMLFDRGWGKPAQEVKHTGEDGGAIKVEIIIKERKSR
jgi:hypothetical protein